MKDFRQQIDHIDQKIVKLLAERMKLVKQIAELKRQNQLPIQDEKREKELRDNLKIFAAQHGLDPEFINHLYSHVFIESRRIQSE
ncbi:chorismate mutase [Candidatus Peregrinibacteria bacterium]|nr:chorismate mutase [Candidatus Peregrinibacteria bacterium]